MTNEDVTPDAPQLERLEKQVKKLIPEK